MRTLAAIIAFAVLAVGVMPPPVEAGAAADAALALGAFAVFNQLWAPVYWGYRYGWPYGYAAVPYPYYAYAPPYYAYAPPPVVYSAPPSAPPGPAIQREVLFPHGRYLLRGDGVTVPYQWVWIPNPPNPPPEPSPGR
jgi:hypothetical protein